MASHSSDQAHESRAVARLSSAFLGSFSFKTRKWIQPNSEPHFKQAPNFNSHQLHRSIDAHSVDKMRPSSAKYTLLIVTMASFVSAARTAPPKPQQVDTPTASVRSSNGSDSASLSGQWAQGSSPQSTPAPTHTTSTPPSPSPSPPPTTTTSAQDLATELPDFISTQNTSTFTCYGKLTGYYADVKLGCRVYHFCTQIDGIEGTSYQRMSYICLEGSLFDQRDLNCVRRADLKVQCEDAEKEYDSSNKQFDARDEERPSMSDSLAASIMMNPIARFIAGR